MDTYQWIGVAFAAVGMLTSGVLIWENRSTKSMELDFLPKTSLMVWISRLLIGGLFLYSGFVKANDYLGFAYKLEEYFIQFGVAFPALNGFFAFFVPLAGPMAWFISVFEIALAVALILGWRMNLTAWLTVLMMVFFTLLTGYSHVTGLVTDCGCFGDALKIEPWESFVKDIILSGMLIPIFLLRKSIHPVPNGRIAGIATGAACLISGIFSYYCHEHLPVVDYRPYKINVDLNICTTQIGEDGYAKCKDWLPYFSSEEFPEGEPALFVGNTLLIVTDKVETAPEKAAEASVALTKTLSSTDIQVIAATSSVDADLTAYKQTYQINYPFAFMDETVLKTIVRSHPGYVLLRNGVILAKWHHN
ncbi:MAG: DoxX family protein, partial [Bacteroidota bacterium]